MFFLSFSFNWEDLSATQNNVWPHLQTLWSPLHVVFSNLFPVFENMVRQSFVWYSSTYLNRTYKKSEGSEFALLLFSCLPLESTVKR